MILVAHGTGGTHGNHGITYSHGTVVGPTGGTSGTSDLVVFPGYQILLGDTGGTCGTLCI